MDWEEFGDFRNISEIKDYSVIASGNPIKTTLGRRQRLPSDLQVALMKRELSDSLIKVGNQDGVDLVVLFLHNAKGRARNTETTILKAPSVDET